MICIICAEPGFQHSLYYSAPSRAVLDMRYTCCAEIIYKSLNNPEKRSRQTEYLWPQSFYQSGDIFLVFSFYRHLTQDTSHIEHRFVCRARPLKLDYPNVYGITYMRATHLTRVPPKNMTYILMNINMTHLMQLHVTIFLKDVRVFCWQVHPFLTYVIQNNAQFKY